jgi:hypothetical protein
MNKYAEFTVGAGIGALVGLLVGLSTATVMGSIISALAAILAAALGLRQTNQEDFSPQPFRLMGFGMFATLALLIGLHLRVQDYMAPSIESRVSEWELAGYEEDIARAYAAFQILGIKPEEAEVLPRPAPITILSSSATPSNCNNLRIGNRTPEQWISAALVEDSPWPTVAAIVNNTEVSAQAKLINVSWRTLCEE